MGSDKDFVMFVCEQLRGAGTISSKRMFGEAAVYLGEKLVILVCDNQAFLKVTAPGRALLVSPTEAPPFPGASKWFLLSDLDDTEFLARLIQATADALPVPTPKPIRKTKTKAKAKAKKTARKPAASRPRRD